jgi:hypothetical protein
MSAGAIPYPIVPPLPLKEERTTIHGLEGSTLAPEQLQNIAEQRAVEQEQANVVARETEHRQKIADVETALETERADEMGRQAAARAKVEAQANSDVDSWKKNLNEAYTAAIRAPAPSLFRGGASTSENVLRAFGMFMIGASDAVMNSIAVQQGRAPGSNQLHDFIAADLATQRDNIQHLNDRVVMARTGVKDANEAREQMLAQVDARGAAVYKRLEALARARLSGMKVPTIQIEGDKRIQELAAEGVKYRQSSVAPLTRKWEQPTKEIINREPTDVKPPQPGSADVEAANRLQSDIKNLDRTIAEIEKNPAAWDEVRSNDESWQRSEAAGKNPVIGTFRAVGQAIPGGLAVAPEQGLTKPESKQIHQGMAGVKTGIAKGYGGVVAKHDVENAGTEIGALNQSASEMAKTLRKWRDTYQRSLTNYQTNRNVRVGDEQAAPVPSATSTAAPEDINSEAPLPEDPKAQSIDELQSKAPAAAPSDPMKATETIRDRAIRMLRANPNRKGATAIRKNYNITDEELRGD